MDEVKRMLRAVINGQSALKQELLGEIRKVDAKVDKGFAEVNDQLKEVNERLDM
jgi:hypothetical protein